MTDIDDLWVAWVIGLLAIVMVVGCIWFMYELLTDPQFRRVTGILIVALVGPTLVGLGIFSLLDYIDP